MNKNLLILNIVLLAAVAVLFYLFFDKKGNQRVSDPWMEVSDTASSDRQFRVAYFDMDSIEANFSLFKEMQAEVSKKEDSINLALNTARMNLQSKYRKYQEQRAGMTPADIEKAGNELTQMDNEIKNNEMSLNQAFQSFYMNKQQEVISQIKKYCLEFNKDKKYSFIISNEPGLIYFKDTTYNITSELLRGLNAIYHSKQKKN